MTPQKTKADYGIDAPGVIRNLFIIGCTILLLTLFLPYAHISIPLAFELYVVFTGIICLVVGALMIVYAKKGKFKHRERILALHGWKGNEKVLDVGTGLGLLMIGAAKKLTNGKSVGIDIWNKEDLSNNILGATKANAVMEGVSDKIEILSEDIIKTSFQDKTFDVVVSNLCLHNISNKADRKKACTEMHRLLNNNGVAIISDFKNTGDYADTFRELGMTVEKMRHLL